MLLPDEVRRATPGLAGRDLLGEQIEALHRENIRAPIYTTVVWEEDVAQKHPKWRQLTREDFLPGGTRPPTKRHATGMWKFNNFSIPIIRTTSRRIARNLRALRRCGGRLVSHILFFVPTACWSEASVRFRERHGLMAEDHATFERFQGLAHRPSLKNSRGSFMECNRAPRCFTTPATTRTFTRSSVRVPARRP